MIMEQQGFTENGFTIDPSFILGNKEAVVDFFGDNRKWYEQLLKGGSTYVRTSLDSQEIVEGEDSNGENDLPPLDEKRVTDGRAETISKFFTEVPGAKDAFIAYHKHYTSGE